jgi:hypothetical protein
MARSSREFSAIGRVAGALGGHMLAVCGEQTRRTEDIIDELVQAVIEQDGSVAHLSAETELRQHLVTASLRFALPAPAARRAAH